MVPRYLDTRQRTPPGQVARGGCALSLTKSCELELTLFVVSEALDTSGAVSRGPLEDIVSEKDVTRSEEP